MNKLIDIARRPAVQRAAIVLYVASLAGLIVAFVSVSLLQVEHALYLQGSSTLQKGRPNAMRAMVLDAPTGQRVGRASMRADLVDGSVAGETSAEQLEALEAAEIARAQAEANGYIHTGARAPDDWAAGDASVVVRVDADGVDDFRVGAPVAVADHSPSRAYWPSRTERLPDDDRRRNTETVSESEGPIQIDLIPADGQVGRGLKSVVFVRTTDRKTHAPIAAEVTFEETEGMRDGELPERVRTDRVGLARLQVSAVTDQSWTLAARPLAGPASNEDGDVEQPEPSRAKLQITTVPSQVSLQMRDVLAVPGESVDGAVHSLFSSGGILVDLYNANHWLQASAFGLGSGAAGVRADIPKIEQPSLLYRVQIYRSLYEPAGAWDIAYLVAAEGRELGDYQRAASQLAAHLAEMSDDPYFDWIVEADAFGAATSEASLKMWIEAMLRFIPRHFDSPPLLINSQKVAREKLEAWKDDVKSDLRLLTALALLVGLAVVCYLVVMGVQSYRRQDQMLRDVELELSVDDPDSAGEVGQLDRTLAEGNVVAGLQIFIVVATLVFFTLGILLLLSYV